MKHEYTLTGLTCNGCVATVKSELLKLPDVLSAEVTKEKAIIEMSKHISTITLQKAISSNGRYTIAEAETDKGHKEMNEDLPRSFFETYKPLILIGLFITGISLYASVNNSTFNVQVWMRYFMAGFFIVFSFFKLLDLQGFAESYAMYDIIAIRARSYGFIYPFIELALGIMYMLGLNPLLTNSVTIIVMGVSSIGVIKSVLDKKKIRCACLGAVFNLPMTTVTIVEDLLMVIMAITSILTITSLSTG